MSEDRKESLPVAKKSRRSLWLILGAGIVLMVVYQSGRSSGFNSARESLPERPAVSPEVSQPVVARPSNSAPRTYRRIPLEGESLPERPAVSPEVSQPVAARPSNSAPRTYRRIPLEGESVPSVSPDTVQQPRVVPRNGGTDIAIPAESPVVPRARMVETVPIGPVLSPQVPRSAPANSVYERLSPVDCVCGPDCPSGCNCGCGHGQSSVLQVGLRAGQPSAGSARPSEVGLIPLQPLQPVSVGQPGVVPATYRQPVSKSSGTVSVRSASTCDCGKEH